jgi:hypothetical protein
MAMRSADMIRLICLVALLAAIPAAALAQPAPADPYSGDVLMQQRMDQQRSVAAENRFNALEAQVQTERRIGDLETQRAQPGVLPRDEKLPLPVGNPPGYAEIPDAALAASNERVRQVVQNRR